MKPDCPRCDRDNATTVINDYIESVDEFRAYGVTECSCDACGCRWMTLADGVLETTSEEVDGNTCDDCDEYGYLESLDVLRDSTTNFSADIDVRCERCNTLYLRSVKANFAMTDEKILIPGNRESAAYYWKHETLILQERRRIDELHKRATERGKELRDYWL